MGDRRYDGGEVLTTEEEMKGRTREVTRVMMGDEERGARSEERG